MLNKWIIKLVIGYLTVSVLWISRGTKSRIYMDTLSPEIFLRDDSLMHNRFNILSAELADARIQHKPLSKPILANPSPLKAYSQYFHLQKVLSSLLELFPFPLQLCFLLSKVTKGRRSKKFETFRILSLLPLSK